MVKFFVAALGIAAIISTGCNKKIIPTETSMLDTTREAVDDRYEPVKFLSNSIDTFSYAVGVNIAESMQGQGIPNINENVMAVAMRAVFNKDSLLISKEVAGITLQEKLKEFADIKAAAAKAKSVAFFEENKAKPGVISLPNGLQYQILKAGSSAAPHAAVTDTVSVNYTGSFLDGTEFDSNTKSGAPATFPLNRVIKGWTEILQLMPKGSKWKVFIPSDLGYGEAGYGNAIPPNTPLIFDIELLDIKQSAKK